MREEDMMRKDKQLFTEKQYKKCLFVVISILSLSSLIMLVGIIVTLVTDVPKTIITGVIIGAIGFVLLMVSVVITLRQAGKIQLYRHYKKHPEEFENEI